MTTLKLKLWQVGNVVLMKVLEQNEATRGRGTLFEYDGLKLSSISRPTLYDDTVLINGNDTSWDNRTSAAPFSTASEATEYIQKVLNLVREYNKTFNTDTDIHTDNEVKIFIAE